MIELIKLDANVDSFRIVPRSAVLVAVEQKERVEVLLKTLLSMSPGHVGFVGNSAEQLCDLFDEMVAESSLSTVTTTHTEGLQEAIWEFLNVYSPLNAESKHSYLVESGDCHLIEFYKRNYKNE